jgi:hypothetical protein
VSAQKRVVPAQGHTDSGRWVNNYIKVRFPLRTGEKLNHCLKGGAQGEESSERGDRDISEAGMS